MRSTQPNPNPSLSPNNNLPTVRVTRPLSVQEPEEKKEKIQDSDGVDAKARRHLHLISSRTLVSSRLVSCGLAAPVLSATDREIPEVYHEISSNTGEISRERDRRGAFEWCGAMRWEIRDPSRLVSLWIDCDVITPLIHALFFQRLVSFGQRVSDSVV